MIALVAAGILYAAAAAMLTLAWRRADGTAETGLREGFRDFLHVLPRLGAGILGAGFIAHLLPQETVAAWLGPDSGTAGVLIAALAGAVTPGGAVVGFSVGAAALKSGAGAAQAAAYITGWSLFTINRMLIWEMPQLPKRFIALRLAASWPMPFLAAGLALLILKFTG